MGQNLTKTLQDNSRLNKGAKILLHKVKKPELYGVAKVNKYKKIVSLKEKPKFYFSDLAVTGFIFLIKTLLSTQKN